MFVPDARGWLHALDAKTGKDLWKANDGNLTTAELLATRRMASNISRS